MTIYAKQIKAARTRIKAKLEETKAAIAGYAGTQNEAEHAMEDYTKLIDRVMDPADEERPLRPLFQMAIEFRA
mgnify:FL=1